MVKEKTRTLLPNLAPDFQVGWLRVDSNISGVVGDVTFGDAAGNFMSSVQLQASPVTDYVFSQVAEGLGFVTGITFLNPNSDPATVDVEVYDLTGNLTGSGSFELQPFEHRPQVLSQIINKTGFSQVQGFIRIVSDMPIFSFELFLFMPPGSGVISLTAVPPQIGNGTASGKVTPGASSASRFAEQLNLALRPRYPASAAKSIQLDPEKEFIPGELIVKMRPDAKAGRVREVSEKMNLRVKSEVPGELHLLGSPALSLQLSYSVADKSSPEVAAARRSTLDLVEALNADPDVLYAEPNYIYKATRTPNDSFYSRQWHYELIDLPAAWDITTGSANTIVAVIDSGVKFAHPDLQGRLSGGQYDFVSDQQRALDGDGMDDDPEDPGDDPAKQRSSYHGTHVAGTIGASTNNGTAVAGIDWSCRLMTLRALGLNGNGSLYDIAQAVRYAAGLSNASGRVPTTRAKVINMSLGGDANSVTLGNAVSAAIGAGVIVVAAAGNDDVDTDFYPASYNGVISVGAVDLAGERAPYSNFGPKISVVAPGGNTAADLNGDDKADGVLSTAWKQSPSEQAAYFYYQGTSMAAPHVTGVISLMLSKRPSMTPAEAKQWLEETARDLGVTGRDDQFGHGLIDPVAAIQKAMGTAPTLPRLAVTESALDFGTNLTQLSVSVFNAGGGTVTGVTYAISTNNGGTGWLTGTASGSTLTVNVNRTGLAAGTYTGKILFESDNGGSVDVFVSMKVGSGLTDIGDIYVIAIDPFTLANVAQVTAQYSKQYAFKLPPTSAGEYVILAGNDKNGNRMLGETGEYFALYPVTSQPSLVEVLMNQDTPGIEFILDDPSAQGASAEAFRAMTGQGGIELKQAPSIRRAWEALTERAKE